MVETFLGEKRFAKSLGRVQSLGTVFALDLKTEHQDGYFNPIRDSLYAYFMERNLLLRPLGNTLYTLVPYCTQENELSTIQKA